MDATPGGKDESKVHPSLQHGQEVEVGDRVLLLMSTITWTIFGFISQVCSFILKCKVVSLLNMPATTLQSFYSAQCDMFVRSNATFHPGTL